MLGMESNSYTLKQNHKPCSCWGWNKQGTAKKHDIEAAGLGVCLQERWLAEKKYRGVGEQDTSPYREILLNSSAVMSSHPKPESLRPPSTDGTPTKSYVT